MTSLPARFVLRIAALELMAGYSHPPPNETHKDNILGPSSDNWEHRDIALVYFVSASNVDHDLVHRGILRQIFEMRGHLSDSKNLILVVRSFRRHKSRLISVEDRGGAFGRL